MIIRQPPPRMPKEGKPALRDAKALAEVTEGDDGGADDDHAKATGRATTTKEEGSTEVSWPQAVLNAVHHGAQKGRGRRR